AASFSACAFRQHRYCSFAAQPLEWRLCEVLEFPPMRTFRLVIACPDRVGIVAKVSNFLASHNGWITEASHHSDNLSGWFFMRHEIRADTLPFDLDGFREAFTPIAEEFSMDWRITDSAQKKRVVLMASRESHCLADLLHRWHSDEL
ncbi:Formyltetrahydrofolate deformylase, partial [Pseudomonas syringae pv. maculicola]